MGVYNEEYKDGIYYRTFDENVSKSELVWHQDPEDRTVISLQETDWKIQLDNCLPISLNDEVFIPKGIYHRLIKGENDLHIKLIKH